jgi:hypothetical protein
MAFVGFHRGLPDRKSRRIMPRLSSLFDGWFDGWFDIDTEVSV